LPPTNPLPQWNRSQGTSIGAAKTQWFDGRYTVERVEEGYVVFDESRCPRRVFQVLRDGRPRYRGRPLENRLLRHAIVRAVSEAEQLGSPDRTDEASPAAGREPASDAIGVPAEAREETTVEAAGRTGNPT
jgi:hypothetical protein